MEQLYITVIGLNHYLEKKSFKVGRIFKLIKDTENEYDTEAIAAVLPYIGTVGYVANSHHTVYDGTCSAGRLYEKIGSSALAEVMFITHSSIIARVLSEEEEKLQSQPFS